MSQKQGPKIRSYLSISTYLQDYYQHRRDHEQDFSYQSWANELQISKSYLQFIVSGRRSLSSKVAFLVSKNLSLQGLDIDYFFALVAFGQSENKEQKADASKKLMNILRQSMELTEISASEALLADPFNMALRNVLSFSDVDRSISNLAKIFNVSEEKIEHVLMRLQATNQVTFEQGQWLATHENVVVKEKLGNDLLIQYHKQILKRAMEVDDLPPDLRTFRSVGLALDEAQYQEYLRDLNEFVTRTFAKFSGASLQSKRVYQLNFNAFPWTKDLVEQGRES